ncbi:hypothetical protein VUJ46_10415 [Chryseobacterium sp. MYb264]|uniref:hypothetical protein n=1 Tax=Chryseobacterium sp. MYb264 TaxID=2745153 RepID=UPI002E115048|nr:hypothetical protein VUJ46_10415 [Chryseobacterium sp. MYb264]
MEKDFLKIAEKYIQENIGADFSISLDDITDLDDIFCFYYQSKKFIETGDHRYMSVGIGPHLLIKSDERIISLPPSYTYDAAIREVRKKINTEKFIQTKCPDYNYWHDNYVLIIDKVYDETKLISILRDYRISYIVPEVIGNSIHRVGKPYKKDELEKRFENLPTEFNTLYGLFSNVLTELIQSFCCELSVTPKIIKKYNSYGENATEADYEIVW